MRPLALFAHNVLTVRKPVLSEARHAGARQTGTMAAIVDVDDPGDPRLADYAHLTDVRLRTSMEPAQGLFMAEGEKVIRRAVAAGFGVRSMLVTRDKLAGLADLARSCPGPVYVISHEVAEQVTGYRVHRGALASMARRGCRAAVRRPAGRSRGSGRRRRAGAPGIWASRRRPRAARLAPADRNSGRSR